MLQFVWHRIKNKKWLNLCLLAGISLLAAVFACHPMFEKGADSSLLQTGFTDYADEHNEFPAAFERSGSYDTKEYQTAQAVYDRIDAYEAKWIEYVDVDPVISQQCLKLSGENALSNLGRANYFLSIGLLRDMDAHIQLVKGKGLTEENESDSGSFPCLVSESVMDTYGLVVGEEINFPYSKNAQGEPARFVITGIFTEAPNQDNYWYHDLTYYDKQIFVSEETFDTLIAEYGYSAIQFEDAMLINYTQINGNNALDYLGYIREFQKADTAFYANFFEMLESYEVQQKTVRTILWVLELPCIVLLLLFLYMVSNQVLSVEEGEIAVLRSRGATKGQTMLLYILQALILSVVGMFAGTALGFFLCKGAAQTDAFLHFVRKDANLYSFTWKMLLYAAIACMIAMLFLSLIHI